jgi:hypothetical protein
MPSSRDMVLRRRRLREAVSSGRSAERRDNERRDNERRDGETGPLRCVEGTIVDVTPHFLVLCAPDGSPVRIAMSGRASVWHAGRAGVGALRAGRDAVVRPVATGGAAAERIWVDITRVTGVITSEMGGIVEVDTGPHRRPVTVLIPGHAMSRVRVRHPRLEAGSLIDVIGVRRDGAVEGLLPATNSPQPAALAGPPPATPRRDAVPHVLRGTATWYDNACGERGAAYPSLDPHGDGGGCGAGREAGLPYLSLACEVDVHNDCTGRGQRLPVIECGCLAARFRDRCVRCGTSPRGRILELTRAAFVDLGGDLDAGCFNVTARVGLP